MDKKILYIALAALFLVLLSTLALIVIVFNPFVFNPKLEKASRQLDSIANLKGGDKDSQYRHDTSSAHNDSSVVYDSLNYSISSLVLKRENLFLYDSTEKLNKEIFYKEKKIDSMKAENKKLKDSLNLFINRVVVYEKKPVTSEGFSDLEKKGYVKIFENMKPEIAAKQLEEMSEMEAIKILLNIDSKQGARILDKVEPKKAAKIWNTLNSKGKR